MGGQNINGGLGRSMFGKLSHRETHFTNRAYLTFVSIDINGKPQPVPGLILETEEEKKEYQQALRA